MLNKNKGKNFKVKNFIKKRIKIWNGLFLICTRKGGK